LSKPLGGTTSSLSRQNAFDLFTRVLIRCVLLFARTRENSFSGGYASFSPTGSSLFAFVINPSYRTSGSPHSQPKRNSARTEITSHRESILYNWWFLSQQLSKRREAERISRVSLSRLWLGEINRVADKFQHKFQPDNVRTRCLIAQSRNWNKHIHKRQVSPRIIYFGKRGKRVSQVNEISRGTKAAFRHGDMQCKETGSLGNVCISLSIAGFAEPY